MEFAFLSNSYVEEWQKRYTSPLTKTHLKNNIKLIWLLYYITKIEVFQYIFIILNDSILGIRLKSIAGYVSLDIKPDYASELRPVIDKYMGETYTAATLLQRHNLDLKGIRIKDEETLLLGGMIQESESNVVSKIPILGDIPLIGFFFRNQHKTMNKEELLFMITPRIIKDTEDVVEL